MIDWGMVAANGLWIVGLALLLAIFSYRSYLRSLPGRPEASGPPAGESWLHLGLLLFSLGILAANPIWWQRILWGALALWVAISWLWPWLSRHARVVHAGQEPATAGPTGSPAAGAKRVAASGRDAIRSRLPGPEGLKLAAILLIALLQGLLYFTLIPPWQHYDEPGHFEYAWLLANGAGPLPLDREHEDPAMRREVAASMLANGFYRNVPLPDLLQESTPIRLGWTQYENPPLYYRLAGLPLRLFSHLDMVGQLRLARLVSLGIYLLTILTVAGLIRELTPPGHLLRWTVPLAATLIGPVADLMTAVNSDVGAVWVFTLFLWGGVRLIRRGFSPLALLWVAGSTALALMVKNTVALALPLAVGATVIGFWRHQGWPWHRLWVAGGIALLPALVLGLSWQDARYWYHWDGWGTLPIQAVDTRQPDPRAPYGRHAAMLILDPAEQHYRLMNPLNPDQADSLANRTVTVGGWFWADGPRVVPAPTLIWSGRGERTMTTLTDAIPVTETPTFVARTYQVGDAGMAYFALQAPPAQEMTTTGRLFVDGAVVAVGTFPPDQEPEFADLSLGRGTWGGKPFVNLVRNPSAEQSWPRIWAPLESAVFGLVERSPTVLLSGLLDGPRTGYVLWQLTPQWLFVGFFTRFAWGHIAVPGAYWPWLLGALLLASTTGAGLWAWRHRERPGNGLWPALAFLALAGGGVWASALLWPITFLWTDRLILPGVRYTFPALAPTVLFLLGGLYGWSRRQTVGRVIVYGALVGLAVVDVLAVITILDYYRASSG